eukprot:TRINITY_DN1564_c0_g1_i6.p2 TRINITY_DN1564_c0_g1~~TRINITY_DN1564_c0_g1_i6.p2  ORF type:complete len:168 (+),score=30.47 TRINITY_DN1564_c0_g1_i6:67-570(+)
MCIRDRYMGINRMSNSQQPNVPEEERDLSRLSSEDENELRTQYRDLTFLLRDKYLPYYNLYQKTKLKHKVNCFESFKEDPNQYYDCIEQIDRTLYTDSLSLEQKFGQIEDSDRECQSRCRDSFSGFPLKIKDCLFNCSKKMKESCLSVYDNFYKDKISKESEFKKLK